jgi:signal transduction histidine kinase
VPRILLIDADEGAQAACRKLLGGRFEIDDARTGAEGLECVREALAKGQPFALAIVALVSSAGAEALEATRRMLELDPDLQLLACTAGDPAGEGLAGLAATLVERSQASRRERGQLLELRRAEREARSYVASITTVNRALVAAKAGAEANSATKSEFLARLAAVLQESSAALLAALELASGPGQAAEQRRESLDAASARCLEICGMSANLALHAALERKQLAANPVRFSPSALLEGIVARWRPSADARGLRLASECLGPLPKSVRGDPQLATRILDALVDNALRYTHAGAVHLCLCMPLRDEGEEPVLDFVVADSGPGIPAAAEAQAFEALAHDQGSGMRGQGAHFSLHLSRQLARLLGGDLVLESAPGQGCIFRLQLPTGDLAGVEFGLHPPSPLPSAGEPGQHVLGLRA